MMTGRHLDRGRLDAQSRALIEILPAPIWVEDWTAVKRFCEEQRSAGCTDLRSLLESDEDLLRKVVGSVIVNAANEHAAEFVGAPDASVLLGTIPASLITGAALKSLLEQILVIWDGGSYIRIDFNGTDMGGADIDCQLEWAAPRMDDVPDYSRVAILIRDVRQEKAEERRIQRNVEQLETLIDIGRGIASTLDVNMILQLLVSTTLELVEADGSLIILVDNDREEVTSVVGEGDDQLSKAEDVHYSEVMEGISGAVIRSRESIRSADVASDPLNGGKAAERAAGLEGGKVAVAPIIVDDLVLGTLTAFNRPDSPEFSDLDLSLVRMLAAKAAVALRNAKLYGELRDSHDAVKAAHEELQRTQTQLLTAQKMEAIGSLAAGIAHEINTPIQFVSDNVTFIRDSIATLNRFVPQHLALLEKLKDHEEYGEHITQLRDEWATADCDFLMEEIPDAVDETLDGANRVADIVRAMKEFAHPGHEELSPSDVNRVVQSTVKVSRNEWKYVSEIELDLQDDLPMVPALPGPLGQSLLIMIVNSAQALGEHRDLAGDGKGTIQISTRELDEAVEIRVSDNGPGIPDEIIDRIFEPFFTTKEVGKGSGQGLSIAHSVITDKHNGELSVESSDTGATFIIMLPKKSS